ncbi:P-II family nitrogen regulator [candidate division KSB1 bacterium]|nr:P-II family nitrogen regulator [candidate division KSB1 bacterium]
MVMIRAIVRPEKSDAILEGLLEAGFPAVTKVSVAGRGQQKGLKVGDVVYDELPKELLMMVVKDQDKDFVVGTICQYAKTGKSGAFGDGKIFITPVEEMYTISSGFKES